MGADGLRQGSPHNHARAHGGRAACEAHDAGTLPADGFLQQGHGDGQRGTGAPGGALVAGLGPLRTDKTKEGRDEIRRA